METMQFHITKMALFLGQYFFNLSDTIEPIGIHKKMSKVFNAGHYPLVYYTTQKSFASPIFTKIYKYHFRLSIPNLNFKFDTA